MTNNSDFTDIEKTDCDVKWMIELILPFKFSFYYFIRPLWRTDPDGHEAIFKNLSCGFANPRDESQKQKMGATFMSRVNVLLSSSGQHPARKFIRRSNLANKLKIDLIIKADHATKPQNIQQQKFTGQ